MQDNAELEANRRLEEKRERLAQANRIAKLRQAEAELDAQIAEAEGGGSGQSGGLTREQMEWARQAYGNAGGGAPPSTFRGGAASGLPPEIQRQQELFQKMIGVPGGPGGGKYGGYKRTITKAEAEEYLSSRTRTVMAVMRQNVGHWVGCGSLNQDQISRADQGPLAQWIKTTQGG